MTLGCFIITLRSMAQLFNSGDFSQPAQTPPTTPNSPHPGALNTPQGQMFRRKSRFRMRTKIFGVLALMLVIAGFPVVFILSRQQQQNQSSAHTPVPKVTAVCQNGDVILTATYTITSVPSGVSCNVTATDSENFLNDSFTATNDSTHTKTANTGESTIPAGVVSYQTTCQDGFKETDQASYKQTTPCISPTPKLTITLTPSPTPKLTNTPTPSICTTPGTIQNVKVTCPSCSGQ